MDVRKFLEILSVAERLKDTTHHCYTSKGRHESVAEHTWMMSLMAFFLRDEFPEVDFQKVMLMIIIHDLGECFTGIFRHLKRMIKIANLKKSCCINGLQRFRNRIKRKCGHFIMKWKRKRH